MTANLLSRLRGLTAPDREVDALIYRALIVDTPAPNGPAYTASLDAVVALCERVLPGKWQYVVESATRTWYLSRPTATVFDLCRALLIAILTALEAREK